MYSWKTQEILPIYVEQYGQYHYDNFLKKINNSYIFHFRFDHVCQLGQFF